ncbi:TPA: cell division protein ZipA [Candidatus Micrarchaeota archaeon]|nr:cell division protein ZipA [Candidatus Micrarchaeota archaeon]
MGLGIREWMIVIGILLLLAVLLDGLRRMRRERRDQLSVAAKMGGGLKHEDDDFPLATIESPKGGTERTEGKQRVEPSIDEEQAAKFFEPAGAPAKAKKKKRAKVSGERHGKPTVSRDHAARKDSQKRAQQPPVKKQVKRAPAKETPAKEIVLVNVLAKNEIGFNGADLLQILLACDMRFGKRKIFHRHEHKNGTGAIQFSMANAVEPGVFDLNNIEEFHTSGVTFFLSLPGPEDPIKAFDYMVETANCLVNNLSGELKDVEQCTMTAQTLEHHRQRVQEFERRQLAHSG